MKSLSARIRGTIAWARGLVSRRRGFDLRGADAEMLQILALQSGDPVRIRRVLDARNQLSPAVAAHAIPLLACEAVARDAVRALQPVAERHAGKLLDGLLDAGEPAAARQRIARVLAGCGSQRVVDGLVAALRDRSRAVRIQCSRALLLIVRRQPHLRVEDPPVQQAILDELNDRAPDLGLVFTLLALVLPRGTIRSAYRALNSRDPHLRGTALEYLHAVLKPEIRDALWPHVRK